MFNFAQFSSVFLFMVARLAGGDMLHFIWLILMALCGRAAGEIVGGKGFGRVADMLLGLSGAFLVRFSVEALRIDVHTSTLLMFSIWGAAALPGSVRFLAKRHGGLKGNASWKRVGFAKRSATDERITAPESSGIPTLHEQASTNFSPAKKMNSESQAARELRPPYRIGLGEKNCSQS